MERSSRDQALVDAVMYSHAHTSTRLPASSAALLAVSLSEVTDRSCHFLCASFIPFMYSIL